MARFAHPRALCTTVTVFIMASAMTVAAVMPAAAASGASSCPRGRAAVSDVAYVIFHSDGSSNNVTTLHGNVRLGDTVNALFNVPALPSGCSQVQLSLASYSRTGHRGHLNLFSSDTGQFLPGGRYEMSTTVAPPPAPEARAVKFALIFATGPVLTHPRYGGNRIASARG